MEEPDRTGASRARLAAAALETRRGIERALHDGTLQDLAALSVRLQLARDEGTFEELRAELHAALDRVRALADDVYPSLLAARGLGEALRAAARRVGLSLRLDGDGGRASPDIEAAAFFACRELFSQAGPGAEVTVSLRYDDGRLEAGVAGAGDAPPQGALDLVEALGGTVAAGGGRVTLSF